jgi:Kef-type K+ transport system membrane component KefB
MPHDSLLFELFFIFVWAKVFGELFEQLSLPAVLGEILAGVVLGPYAFGIIVPSDTVNSIAEVGAVFLLFTVGLETRPKELIKVGQQSLAVAATGILLPFVFGFLYIRARGGALHEATFVAAAMVATSVGITARVLADMRLLGTRVARIILGAAVFDDILGMVLLAVVIGLVSAAGVQWLQLGVLLVEAVGFALIMIFVGPRVVHHMRPGLKRMSMPNAPLILALAICLGLSVAAEKIGLAAIIGAFFAGLVFAEYSPEWSLQPRVRAINEFLAPYFFFTMGARFEIHVFRGKVLLAAIIISLLAIVSKVVGCALPLYREGWRNAFRVGVGMMPRGEVALIVALVGHQMKIITPGAYAIVIFMTGATTLLAPPFLRILFRDVRPSESAPAAEPAVEPASLEP